MAIGLLLVVVRDQELAIDRRHSRLEAVIPVVCRLTPGIFLHFLFTDQARRMEV